MPEQIKPYELKENEAGIDNGLNFTIGLEPVCEFIKNDDGLSLQITIPLDSGSFFPIDGNPIILNPSNVITFETNKNLITSAPSVLFSAKPGGDVKLSASFSIKGTKHTTG